MPICVRPCFKVERGMGFSNAGQADPTWWRRVQRCAEQRTSFSSGGAREGLARRELYPIRDTLGNSAQLRTFTANDAMAEDGQGVEMTSRAAFGPVRVEAIEGMADRTVLALVVVYGIPPD